MKLIISICVGLLPQLIAASIIISQETKKTNKIVVNLPKTEVTSKPDEESLPSSTSNPMDVQPEVVEARIRQAFERYTSKQRDVLSALDDDLSKVPLKTYIRGLMDDFDSTELEWISESGTVQYSVMLQKKDGPLRHENLLMLNHKEASKYCSDNCEGGTLLTIHSELESKIVTDWLFNIIRVPGKIWLGARRNNNETRDLGLTSLPQNISNFIWVDNGLEAEFYNWNFCEPNGKFWGENCIEMYSRYYPYPRNGCGSNSTDDTTGKWNDIPCDSGHHNIVVCKKVIPETPEVASTKIEI